MFLRSLIAFIVAATLVSAQTAPAVSDGTVLKQIIVFSRHGVRSSALPNSTLNAFATRPYPAFSVPAGYLTPNGQSAEILMGSYFRAYLIQQGLLSGSAPDDAVATYFRANSIQRSNVSAAARWAGLFPGITPQVHSFPLGQPDPIFDPIAAQIVAVDGDRASAEVRGVVGNGDAIRSASSAELNLIRGILLNTPAGTPAPAGTFDVTAGAIPLTVNATPTVSNIVNLGPMFNILLAADPWVMQYTDGFALSDVAWGSLTLDQLSQQTRIINLLIGTEVSTPYLNELSSSNAASHVLRTMEQAVTGSRLSGSFGDASTKVAVISSSDAYVDSLAAMLRAHWMLPGYQPDYCPPGGSLVFELRQTAATGQYLVRVYFTSQTFNQLRNLTPLTLTNPPATMQLAVPGSTKAGSSLDIRFSTFEQLMKNAINTDFVDNIYTEAVPGVLTGVPLK